MNHSFQETTSFCSKTRKNAKKINWNSDNPENFWEAHCLVVIPASELPHVLGREELASLVGDRE